MARKDDTPAPPAAEDDAPRLAEFESSVAELEARLTYTSARSMLVEVDVYAREEIEIPRCAATLKDIKDREIASSTASNSELARQYGMTERNVRKIRRRVEARNNNDQIGLFD